MTTDTHSGSDQLLLILAVSVVLSAHFAFDTDGQAIAISAQFRSTHSKSSSTFAVSNLRFARTMTDTSRFELSAARYGKDKVRVFRVVRNGDWHDIVEYNVCTLLEGEIATRCAQLH